MIDTVSSRNALKDSDRFMNPTINLSKNKSRFIMLGVILVCAALIRILFFNGGIRGTDAYLYALHAYEMANGLYQIDSSLNYYALRFVLLLPVSLCYSLFGVNDISSALFPFVCSIASIIIIYILGEKLFDRKTAFVAGFLLAFFPLDIMTATILLTDSLLPFFAVISILFFILASEQKNFCLGNTYYFLCGISIYLATSVRITACLLFAVLVCHQILALRNNKTFSYRSLGIVALGITLPYLAEVLYLYSYTGDLLFRIHQINSYGNMLSTQYEKSFIDSLLYYPKGMLGFNQEGLAHFGLTWWLALAGAAIAIRQKHPHLQLLSLWIFIPLAGYICIGVMIPQAVNYKLPSIFSPPAILLAAYFLCSVTCSVLKKTSSIGLAVVMVCLIVINTYGAYRITQNIRDDDAPYIAVADALRESPCRDLYISPHRWPTFLGYYLRYNPCVRYHNLEMLSKDEMERLNKGTIILHNRYITLDPLFRTASEQPFYASYLDSPPSGWKEIFSYTGEPTYNSVVVYEVGD